MHTPAWWGASSSCLCSDWGSSAHGRLPHWDGWLRWCGSTVHRECLGLGSPLFMPVLKSKSGLWRESLRSSAMQLPAGTCVFLRYTKDSPAVQLEMSPPLLLDLWIAFFTLSYCGLLTCLVTLSSLSMTICPSIIPSESARISACLIKWMNPCVN